MGKFIDFSDVERLASIEQLVEMLGLQVKQENSQLRASCPVHGGDNRTLAITPGVKSRRGSLGVFFCQKAQTGGDRIALVSHCMDIGQQDAAFFIAEQFAAEVSNSHSTVKVRTDRATFDPVKFAAGLQYTPEVKALGLTEEDARAFRIGSHRGHIYIPQVYATGVVAGWSKLEGTLTRPTAWLPDNSNVVPIKKAG